MIKENNVFKLIVLILVAFIFSVGIRMIWVYQFNGVEQFMWNGQLMINTNDGYYFASGVQKALYDIHLHNPRIPDIFQYGMVFFSYLFTKITSFSLETVILYMPSIISSLVVIPIILIGKLFNKIEWGFFAALLGSITWSYYNRTMVGYYDTDMFSAMAPMFILYFLIKSTIDNNLKSALYAAIMIAIYPFLYDQGLSIVYAMGIMYAIYMIFYHRDEKNTYLSFILIFISLLNFKYLGILPPLNYIFKIIILIAVYFLLSKTQEKIDNKKLQKLQIISLFLFISFLLAGNVFGLIYHKIMGYLAQGTEEAGNLHFFAVNQTVREAGHIPFETFANRISGSVYGLIIAIIGYILLIIKYRAFILALPLVGIGAFALFGGLRFTVYAVPIAAVSSVFLFGYILNSFIKQKKFYYLSLTILTAILIYPNIKHIINYKVPTVFVKDEIKVLDKLKQISNSKDYTLTWWDYGYPIWFYSNTNTLVDGGKHNHDNFIASQILTTTSQIQAVNLSRLAVEKYISSDYKIVADLIFKDTNPNELLDSLNNKNFKLPKKTRDIYLYLPNRMLNIFTTITLFSNIDLLTGQKKYNLFFVKTRAIKDYQKYIYLANGFKIDKSGKIIIGNKIIPIHKFILTRYQRNGRLNVAGQIINPNSNINVIFMQNYNQFLILDDRMLNSTYIQLFVLENYDKDLFEPIIMTPLAKVYKLKR